MKTPIEVLLILVLIVLNVLLGSFLLFNIHVLSIPEMSLRIDITEIHPEYLKFQAILDINNQNSCVIG